MTTAGWLALAGLCALLLVPTPVAGRALVLARAGRLAVRADAQTRGVRRPGAVALRRLPVPLAALGAALVWVRVGVLPALTTAAVLGTAVLIGRDTVRRRSVAARRRELLAAVRVLVAELEAGSRPSRALSAAGAAGGAASAVFVRAAAALEDGEDAAALLCVDADPHVRAVGVAWALGSSTGAALAGVLGRVGADLAAAAELRRAVAVALAGPRSSAGLLAGLPLLGLVLGTAMGARPLALLTGTPAGQLLCAAGVALDLAGILWMRRILRHAEDGPAGGVP